jgi:beta-phosphoglucomutase-like phosphatase (HAD superfamily)
VVVEDSVFGAKAGLAAGMRVVGYGPYLDDLTALGVLPLENMARLPDLLATLD